MRKTNRTKSKTKKKILFVNWLTGCLTSQQHANISQARIDNCTCCHTEIEAAYQISISPSHSILTPGQIVSADRKTPGAWQGSH